VAWLGEKPPSGGFSFCIAALSPLRITRKL
jgi:hypothetical protein